MSEQQNIQPAEVYFTLTGDVNQQMTGRVFNMFAVAVQQRAPEIHLLLQTGGGSIADGVCMHNYIRNLPVPVHIYNAGNVGSSGVLIYLAGKRRFTAATASFMIHKPSTGNIAGIGGGLLTSVAESMAIDEARTFDILTRDTKFPDEIIKTYHQRDVHITAVDALSWGLIHEIKDFAPPLGAQVFNI